VSNFQWAIKRAHKPGTTTVLWSGVAHYGMVLCWVVLWKRKKRSPARSHRKR